MIAYSWESQARQYAYKDTPGIGFERHSVGQLGALDQVDCLLWRDDNGVLRGILNHYPTDSEWEKAGNVNLWVDPGWQRRGIATALLAAAMKRWTINLKQQRYTDDGILFILAFVKQAA